MSVELDDSYESIYQRAITQMGFGQSEQAIESLWRIVNRLTRLRPQTLQRKERLRSVLATSLQSLIQFLRWEGRYDDAISACEKALDHLPDLGFDGRICSLMIERGEVEEGLSRLRHTAEEQQSFGLWADLGAEYIALERYEEAEPCYRTALSLADSNESASIAHMGLLHIAKETDRVQDVLSAWNMIAVLDPDMGDEVAEVYTWLLDRGDLEQAKKYLNRERDRQRRAYYQGMLDLLEDRESAARTKWRQVLDQEITDESEGELWIRAALLLDEPQRAITAEDALLDRDTPPSIDEAVALGIAYAALDDVEQARSWFDQVIGRLRRGWPSMDRIDAGQWAFLTSVVDNQETVQALAEYFQV